MALHIHVNLGTRDDKGEGTRHDPKNGQFTGGGSGSGSGKANSTRASELKVHLKEATGRMAAENKKDRTSAAAVAARKEVQELYRQIG